MSDTPTPPENRSAGFVDYLFALLQYPLPHHLLSQAMYWLTRIEWAPLKDLLIRSAIRVYGIDMQEAADPKLRAYRSFNEFFTRALKPDARPMSDDPAAILCPADGALSQAGSIQNGTIFQAKGHDYALSDLLGGDEEWTDRFDGGRFATIYLSPKDYHRVHMPYGGVLKKMVHVPGRLFSVNPATTRSVPGLFARNERVVCLFDTPAGPMAVILVGAIFVASIDTVWAGAVAPRSRQVSRQLYGNIESEIALSRGEEMGRFNMGSTVIVLFGPNTVDWSRDFTPGASLRMGQTIGKHSPKVWV